MDMEKLIRAVAAEKGVDLNSQPVNHPAATQPATQQPAKGLLRRRLASDGESGIFKHSYQQGVGGLLRKNENAIFKRPPRPIEVLLQKRQPLFFEKSTMLQRPTATPSFQGGFLKKGSFLNKGSGSFLKKSGGLLKPKILSKQDRFLDDHGGDNADDSDEYDGDDQPQGIQHPIREVANVVSSIPGKAGSAVSNVIGAGLRRIGTAIANRARANNEEIRAARINAEEKQKLAEMTRHTNELIAAEEKERNERDEIERAELARTEQE